MAKQWGKFEMMARGVMARIGVERERIIRTAKRKLAVFGLGAVVSLGVMVPVFQWIGAEFYKSGFFQFASLIFTDTTVMAAYWKELGMSMIESLPLMEITLLLSVVFVFFWAIKMVGDNMERLSTANFQ